MDRVEAILAKSRYLTGDKLTLADIRLWTTLVRFDPVYYGEHTCVAISSHESNRSDADRSLQDEQEEIDWLPQPLALHSRVVSDAWR